METTQEKPVFLASFKGYYPLEQTIQMIEQLLEKVKSAEYETHIAAPLDYLQKLNTHFAGRPLKFGADMMLSADDGSFTKSIANRLLRTLSCDFALIGSADERHILSATETSLQKKILSALEQSITPILAIGETLQDFDDGHSVEIMSKQLREDLADLSPEQLEKIHLLYDAPWITNSCWGDTSEYVPKAFSSFTKVATDFFGDKIAKVPLFFSIPCFAEHLPQIPKGIHFGGYYFGVMTPSHTVEPIHLFSHATESTHEESLHSQLQHAELPETGLHLPEPKNPE